MTTVIAGVPAFSAVVFFISYRMGKAEIIERGKLAAYVTLLMCASLLWGKCIMWLARR